MYHSVDGACDPRYARWCVSPATFRRHMAHLADGGYTVLTIGDIVDRIERGIALPERAVGLTFDDGLEDFATGAMPILREFSFPATLFVVAGLIGRTSEWLAPLGEGRRPMLTADAIRGLADEGIEIGGHSLSHPQLDVLSAAAAADEIVGSRQRLETVIGGPVRSFAYPHGFASRTTRRLAQLAGYRSAVRVRHALSSTDENRYGLSRLIITEAHDDAGFADCLAGRGLSLAPPADRLASDCFRFVRRIQYRLGGDRNTSTAA
jgi:peptidoglycan/xylan/chitin deacetylase (PgdA/CDA1 family)